MSYVLLNFIPQFIVKFLNQICIVKIDNFKAYNLPTTHYDAFAACATYIYTLDIKSKFGTSC